LPIKLGVVGVLFYIGTQVAFYMHKGFEQKRKQKKRRHQRIA